MLGYSLGGANAQLKSGSPIPAAREPASQVVFQRVVALAELGLGLRVGVRVRPFPRGTHSSTPPLHFQW